MAALFSRRFLASSFGLGFGFGALADGIVLHQILQWHNLLTRAESNQTLEGLRRNLFWDGVFHMTAAGLTAGAVLVLWGTRDSLEPGRRPLRMLVGIGLIGWGAFHAADQFAFHLILDLHNIREGVDDPGLYNWIFFAIGIFLGAIGWIVVRSARGARAVEGRAT